MTTFVASPGVATQLRSLSRSYLCPSGCRHNLRRLHRAPVMSSSLNLDQPDSFDSNIPENTQTIDDSDFIVHVADNDPDIDEEGLNVVNVPAGPAEKRKKVRENIARLVSEIDVPPISTVTSDADSQPPIQDDETAKYIRIAVKAADKRKAEDIVAMRVSKLTYVTSFVMIATGNNAPQLRAIANLVEEDLKKIHNLSPRRIDGVANSGWILLDYGDFLINIFSPEQRRIYDLESLWRRAENMDISDCVVGQPDQPEVASSDSSLDDWLSE